MMGIRSHRHYSGGLPEHRDSMQILVVDVSARLGERDIGIADVVLFNEFVPKYPIQIWQTSSAVQSEEF